MQLDSAYFSLVLAVFFLLLARLAPAARALAGALRLRAGPAPDTLGRAARLTALSRRAARRTVALATLFIALPEDHLLTPRCAHKGAAHTALGLRWACGPPADENRPEP